MMRKTNKQKSQAKSSSFKSGNFVKKSSFSAISDYPRRVSHDRKLIGKRKEGEGSQICLSCHAVYRDKAWWWDDAYYLENLQNPSVQKVKKCWACSKIPDSLAEGEITIKDVSDINVRKEMLNLIQNIAVRRTKRDPLDRLIRAEEKGGDIFVSTSENQFAVSIARQIERAFKGWKADITWSEGEDIVRIIIKNEKPPDSD